MINPKTIELVKATAPVLKVHGEQITTVFYRRLFERHPDMKNIFNMTHQKLGGQPKVLANAIFQYAQHIDKLELLGGAVESIAQKHTSLTITPKMYPIVGENLLAAIQEVLGAAATPEIIDAWAEAYQALSAILMSREEDLYDTRAQEKGGFRGQKEFIVAQKVKESDVITSFYLKRKDGTPVPPFMSGQYISLTVDIPNSTHKHTRNYSLSDLSQSDYLRISVKREGFSPKGVVSNYLHDSIAEGDELLIGMPSGEFVLQESNRPVVLLAGGVGITPLMSMYKQLVKTTRPVTFVQCALNSAVHAFKQETLKHIHQDAELITVYDQPLASDQLGVDYDYEGYLSATILAEIPNLKEQEFYFCGPKAFMKNTKMLLLNLGIAEGQIHYEFFGPKEELEANEPVLAS